MSGKITSDEREDPEIMRDRIPTAAGGDRLAGKKDVKSLGLPGGGPLCDRVRVKGRKNLVSCGRCRITRCTGTGKRMRERTQGR